MKHFACQSCNALLFFENRTCGNCGHTLGYLPVENELSALEPLGNDQWSVLALPGSSSKFCKNYMYDACNWMIPTDATEEYCIACRHNRTVPDLSDATNLNEWRKLELAKHRLFYTLLRLHLPTPTREDDEKSGLEFDFLNDPVNGEKVMTGHDEGLITLALKEADDAEREKRRTSMHEPYRTLLGHFRHEIGHYYWDRLVADCHHEEECRALFGDDREDYGEALKKHYKQGAPANWQAHYISEYATSHPWEDFAETWAHYLHIVDSLETAKTYGLHTDTATNKLNNVSVPAAYRTMDFEQLIEAWVPLTLALNAMNRSMGLNDLYPFVLSADVIKKMSFIHNLVHHH